MKPIITLVFVAVTTLFLTISCSDNDPQKRPDIPETIDASKTYNYELLVAAGSSVTMPKELKLEDFKTLGTYAKYVKRAKIRTSSKIIISGVTAQKQSLQDLNLRVKGTNIKKDFGTVTQDAEFDFLEDNAFIQKLINKLISAQTITLELTTTSKKTIQKDVKVALQIDAQFILQ